MTDRDHYSVQQWQSLAVALEAKLDAIHRYVADRADSIDRPDCGSYPNAEARIWQEFFDGKEPDA